MARAADTAVACRDAHVANLTGSARSTGIELVIDDDAASDAGGNSYKNHVTKAAAGTEVMLADAGTVRIVLEQRRHAEALADDACEGDVVPAGEVRGIGNDA